MPVTRDLTQPRTILSFDFGLRRIGVAVGQDVTGSASPLGIVANRQTGPDHARLRELIREWQPTQLVVGMPSHADGSTSDMHAPVNAFNEELSRYELPIESIDERYTSVEAERVLKEARAAGTRGRISKDMIDSAAAVFIAERYLASSYPLRPIRQERRPIGERQGCRPRVLGGKTCGGSGVPDDGRSIEDGTVDAHTFHGGPIGRFNFHGTARETSDRTCHVLFKRHLAWNLVTARKCRHCPEHGRRPAGKDFRFPEFVS